MSVSTSLSGTLCMCTIIAELKKFYAKSFFHVHICDQMYSNFWESRLQTPRRTEWMSVGRPKAKEAKKKRKSENNVSVCVAIQSQRMKMLAGADGLRKLWCVRCKWKSTPCVLHFNLTSFHSGPNSLPHTRARLWHSMLSQCLTVRVCHFFCVIFVDFSPATTINHIPTIFAPESKWNKGQNQW